mgnify:CR=1 FL=1
MRLLEPAIVIPPAKTVGQWHVAVEGTGMSMAYFSALGNKDVVQSHIFLYRTWEGPNHRWGEPQCFFDNLGATHRTPR